MQEYENEGFVVRVKNTVHFIPNEAKYWDEQMWQDFFEELGCNVIPINEWKQQHED